MRYTNTVYSKSLLRVVTTVPNTFSHLLNCHCQTVGAEHKERAYILKKVNFYKFKAYITKEYNITNFTEWYFNSQANGELLTALASYINQTEKRQGVYLSPNSTTPLDSLILNTEHSNKTLTNRLRAC